MFGYRGKPVRKTKRDEYMVQIEPDQETPDILPSDLMRNDKTKSGVRYAGTNDRGEQIKDDKTNILIFGATGMIGGAVLEACRASPFLRITGFTRATESDMYMEIMREEGIKMVTGDMFNYQSVVDAMEEIDTVFLNTHFWESMSKADERRQGLNVLNACLQRGIRHLIYASSDYTDMTCEEKCRFLGGKSDIEVAIVNSGIPYTIAYMGFFYESMLGLFKPHLTDKDTFAIPFPMEEKSMNMLSVLDYGFCISKIALMPKKFCFTTVKTSSEYLGVDDVVSAFNNVFRQMGISFYDPQLSIEEYRSLHFEGCKDLTAMWEHLQHSPAWSCDVMTRLQPSYYTFREFVEARRERFLIMFDELQTGSSHPEDQSSKRSYGTSNTSSSNSCEPSLLQES